MVKSREKTLIYALYRHSETQIRPVITFSSSNFDSRNLIANGWLFVDLFLSFFAFNWLPLVQQTTKCYFSKKSSKHHIKGAQFLGSSRVSPQFISLCLAMMRKISQVDNQWRKHHFEWQLHYITQNLHRIDQILFLSPSTLHCWIAENFYSHDDTAVCWSKSTSLQSAGQITVLDIFSLSSLSSSLSSFPCVKFIFIIN